jgi:hypothetical protein
MSKKTSIEEVGKFNELEAFYNLFFNPSANKLQPLECLSIEQKEQIASYSNVFQHLLNGVVNDVYSLDEQSGILAPKELEIRVHDNLKNLINSYADDKNLENISEERMAIILSKSQKIIEQNDYDPQVSLEKLIEKILPILKSDEELLWSIYAHFYSGLFLLLPYKELQEEIADTFFGENISFQNKNMLALGCATDPLQKIIKDRSIEGVTSTGIDYSNAMLEVAKKSYTECDYITADLNRGIPQLPKKKTQADFIAFTNALEFLDEKNVPQLFENIYNIASHNADLIITTPAEGFVTTIPIFRKHLQYFEKDFSDEFWNNFDLNQFPKVAERLCEDITDRDDQKKILMIILCNLCFASLGGARKTKTYTDKELKILCELHGFEVQKIKKSYAGLYSFVHAKKISGKESIGSRYLETIDNYKEKGDLLSAALKSMEYASVMRAELSIKEAENIFLKNIRIIELCLGVEVIDIYLSEKEVTNEAVFGYVISLIEYLYRNNKHGEYQKDEKMLQTMLKKHGRYQLKSAKEFLELATIKERSLEYGDLEKKLQNIYGDIDMVVTNFSGDALYNVPASEYLNHASISQSIYEAQESNTLQEIRSLELSENQMLHHLLIIPLKETVVLLKKLGTPIFFSSMEVNMIELTLKEVYQSCVFNEKDRLASIVTPKYKTAVYDTENLSEEIREVLLKMYKRNYLIDFGMALASDIPKQVAALLPCENVVPEMAEEKYISMIGSDSFDESEITWEELYLRIQSLPKKIYMDDFKNLKNLSDNSESRALFTSYEKNQDTWVLKSDIDSNIRNTLMLFFHKVQYKWDVLSDYELSRTEVCDISSLNIHPIFRNNKTILPETLRTITSNIEKKEILIITHETIIRGFRDIGIQPFLLSSIPDVTDEYIAKIIQEEKGCKRDILEALRSGIHKKANFQVWNIRAGS